MQPDGSTSAASPHAAADRAKVLEQTLWNAAADTFADGPARVTAAAAEHLLERAEIGPGSRVIDICCGTAVATAALVRAGATALGVDFASRMIASADARGLNAQFQIGDAEALDVRVAEFDVAAVNMALLHVGDPLRALKEAHRALRPGGRVVWTFWARGGPAAAWTALDRAAEGRAGRASVEAIARDEAVALTEAAGFGAVEAAIAAVSAPIMDGSSALEEAARHSARLRAALDAADPAERAAWARDVQAEHDRLSRRRAQDRADILVVVGSKTERRGAGRGVRFGIVRKLLGSGEPSRG